MTPPRDALVFDMDGTLLDSYPAIAGAYVATLTWLGVTHHPRERIVETFRLGPPGAILGALIDREASPEEIERYHAELTARARDAPVYPGIPEALAELARRVPLGLFTNASTRSAEILLEVTGLLGPFATVLGGDDVPAPKPAPDGVLLACERLGVETARSAYVGDAWYDLEAARAAGATAVAAGWGHLFRPSMDADMVAHTPADLLTLVR